MFFSPLPPIYLVVTPSPTMDTTQLLVSSRNIYTSKIKCEIYLILYFHLSHCPLHKAIFIYQSILEIVTWKHTLSGLIQAPEDV